MTASLRTSLCELLGIELPIVQAPLGGITTPELAAAVSEAGGLGMLPLTWADERRLRDEMRAVRERTSRPFGVNLVLEWDMRSQLHAVLEEGARIVSFFWGDPGTYVPDAHDAGAFVLHTVGSAEEARRAVDAGVDVIVAQGWEAGGHVWGEVATMALVPQVVDAVAPVPVVAAGGIADGRGVAAALCLGAAGAWVGTRFVLAAESLAHETYRERLVGAGGTDTVHTTLFDGGWPDAPLRALRNRTVEDWEAAGSPGPGGRPGEGEVVARTAGGRQVERYDSTPPRTEHAGEVEAMCLYAGQAVGLLDRVQPASEIVAELVSGARAVLAGAAG